MGDTVRVRNGERLAFTVHAAGVAGAIVSIVEDGAKIAPIADPPIVSNDARKTFAVTFDGKRHWLRADVRDAKRRLLLIGNPIYVNF
jgi:hypothetical protein